MRGAALGTALIGGGALFHVWQPFPLLVAAAGVTAACASPVLLLREDGGHGRVFEEVRAYLSHGWNVVPARSRRAPLPDRELGLGGGLRRRAHVPRALLTVGLGQLLGMTTWLRAAEGKSGTGQPESPEPIV
jgi:hypothetical protein